ncbi:pyrin domain-containing protein 1 [Cynocephalus volans]|uniref:pyrin domain-containing protein 1 n=1 Tax=Cynocephalus volans TaxID=110931 RepID=UPI002FC89D9C
MGGKRDAILEALENLTADELKKFKLKLGAGAAAPGLSEHPAGGGGVLGPLEAVDLTDKLVAFYCEEYGAELTAVVLRDMGMQEEAMRLQGAT